MNDLRNYDEAAHKFYNSIKINSLPICSSDFYISFFSTLCNSFNDALLLTQLAKSNKWNYRNTYDTELIDNDLVIVVTDTQLNIVYASQNIKKMNGYKPNEILGKKPKMFQGTETCKKTTKVIREAVNQRKSFEAVILNYRKDGSSYNCWIKGHPVFNTSGEVINFIAYEKEVA